MRRQTLYFALFALGIFILALWSCKKKSEGGLIDIQSEADNSLMEDENSSIFNFVDFSGSNSSGVNRSSGPDTFNLPMCPCAQVIVSDTNSAIWPKIVTIDFGTTGCQCNDGVVRKGRMDCIYEGPYSVANNSVKVTLTNYTVNNIVHNVDSILIVRISAGTGVWIRTVDIYNERISFPEGTAELNCHREINWLRGDTTKWGDDIYEIKGWSSGINRKQKKFDTVIKIKLIKKANCKNIVEGVVEITPEGHSTRTVDFGNGLCDDIAVVTVDGKNFTIRLR